MYIILVSLKNHYLSDIEKRRVLNIEFVKTRTLVIIINISPYDRVFQREDKILTKKFLLRRIREVYILYFHFQRTVDFTTITP